MNFGPQISILGENNITALTSFDAPVLVAHIAKADEDSAKVFNEAASSLLKEKRFIFGTTTNSKLAGIEDDFELPFVALYNPSDEAKPTYHGPFDPESIANFALQAASAPLIGRFSLESLAAYADTGLCLALIFALKLEERQKIAHALKPLAEKHRGSLNFATVDASKFGFLAGELGLQPDQYPAFLIYDINSDGIYPFDQSKEITREIIEGFVESLFTGRKVTGVEATLTFAEPKRTAHMHDEV